ILDATEGVVGVGDVLEDVIERDRVERGTGVDERRQRRAVDLEAARASVSRRDRRRIDADVLELLRREGAEAAVAHANLEDARARRELSADDADAAQAGLLARG